MQSSKLSQKLEIYKQNFGIAITAIVILLIVVKGFEFVNPLYYLIILILLLNILSEAILCGNSNSKLGFTIHFLPFILWILLSSFWSIHQEVTFKRAIYFIFLVLGMGSLSHLIPNNVNALIKVFLPTIIIVVVVSILSLIAGIPHDYLSGGNGLGLKGFTTHQNMLGSLMYFFTSIMTYRLYNLFYEKRVKNSVFWFSASLNIAALLLLIITFSRSAIIAYIIFIIVFGMFSLGIKKTIGLITLLIIVLVIFSRVEPTSKFINYAIYKGSDNILGSRSVMYKASLSAAKNGGLIGIGYGVSNPSIIKGVPGNEVDGIFIREKGSTVLGLIEEAGFIGLVLFYLPVGILFFKAVRSKKEEEIAKPCLRQKYDLRSTMYEGPPTPLGMTSETNEKKFLIAIIIAMIVHSQFEAWGIGVGSVMLPVYLLIQFRLGHLLNIKH